MNAISAETRSSMMRSVQSKDTEPEMLVRRYLHKLGFRYLLHDKRLPGRPDLVFPLKKRVIFVHGCFWHQHSGCRHGHAPKSRLEYWLPKLRKNVLRDEAARLELSRLGWSSLVIWECELEDMSLAGGRAIDFLSGLPTS
jgi:DNA mismatch endonuclease (patch repair protein)